MLVAAPGAVPADPLDAAPEKRVDLLLEGAGFIQGMSVVLLPTALCRAVRLASHTQGAKDAAPAEAVLAPQGGRLLHERLTQATPADVYTTKLSIKNHLFMSTLSLPSTLQCCAN